MSVQTEQKQQDKGPQSLYLLKSEPHEFSIDDLASREEQTEPWDGVRNYQAISLPTMINQAKMPAQDVALFATQQVKYLSGLGHLPIK